jgi:hypothetical protein
MLDRVAALRVVLRVLTAITERRCPDEADVEQLRELSDLDPQAPADELAHDVMAHSLEHFPATEQPKGKSKSRYKSDPYRINPTSGGAA